MNAAEQINEVPVHVLLGQLKLCKWMIKIASILIPYCVGIDCVRSPFVKAYWAAASARFTTTFINNSFGHKCGVCDRLWLLHSLTPTKKKHLPMLNNTEKLVTDFIRCYMSKNSLDSDKVPT
ncbi:uncharacterized protein TNCT_318501 [Trichonephila clavata]|uniref:Uncharacterized protein n=1 Tax=Trichonephila clavata TaxID=2740835 RepID=A0A8X6GNL2_TRICU|nr:uncharacterized protein TNCT_318501 [Trichonephila clavata]